MKQYTALLLLILTCLSARAQTGTLGSGCFTNPPNFVKLAYGAADSAVIEEDGNIYWGSKKICPEYVTNLVNQLRYGGLDNDKKVLAIWLLGELKSADPYSTKFLIEFVDLKATKVDPKTRVSRWGDYPCQEALIKLEMPAVDPILQDLPGETNQFRIQLLCRCLIQVEGHKNKSRFSASDGKTIAQNQIKQMLLEEKDSAKRANLTAALKEIEK